MSVKLKFYSDGKWLGMWIFSFCALSTLVLALSLAHQVSVGCGLARAVTEQDLWHGPCMWLCRPHSSKGTLAMQHQPFGVSVSEVSREMTL